MGLCASGWIYAASQCDVDSKSSYARPVCSFLRASLSGNTSDNIPDGLTRKKTHLFSCHLKEGIDYFHTLAFLKYCRISKSLSNVIFLFSGISSVRDFDFEINNHNAITNPSDHILLPFTDPKLSNTCVCEKGVNLSEYR